MVQTSHKLLQKKGILSYLIPEKRKRKKKGKEISQEKVDKVFEFYCNDENSRQMPRKKDFVSIARRSHAKAKDSLKSKRTVC